MNVAFNSERGEVPLTVGGVDLVIAAEMGKLAELSSRLGCKSFGDLFGRLVNVEIAAVVAAVELLAVKGDVGLAAKKLSLRDLPACKTAFYAALMHHAAGLDQGNAVAAGEREATPSLGGNGKGSPSEI